VPEVRRSVSWSATPWALAKAGPNSSTAEMVDIERIFRNVMHFAPKKTKNINFFYKQQA
tara:strand:- start:220 stop:396 length:177 start_codon:yes stop_codon:yes gene_type:complete